MREKTRQQIRVENRIRQSTLITLISDLVLIVALVFCLLAYASTNNANTYKQNVDSVTDIAKAKSGLMLSALSNSSHEVEIAYRFCSGKSVAEIMDYLSLIGDEENEYQLLKLDEDTMTDNYRVYSGYSTRKENGENRQIQYRNTALASSIYQHSERPNGEICYSQGFTNNTDGQRYFSAFCSLDAMENGTQQRYYIVKPLLETKILDLLQTYTQLGRLDTAICYADGKYLAKDDSFRADNFFDYIYEYNNLSIDQRNAIRDKVRNDGDGGYLEYKDLKRQDCVFGYSVCGEENNWYIFVSAPVDEFIATELLSFFPLIIIIFLAGLLVFNTWRLLLLVRQLRQSVARERIASESKSSFLSRMSHEIRTPLNAVIGYNTIAKDEIKSSGQDETREEIEAKVMDCLVKSDIASKHLLTIINDVLDMSAIESGKIKFVRDRFDFKGLITSLTTVFYSQARSKGVDFKVLFDNLSEEWFIGDQMRTSQILTNLLSNAIKFTSEGGEVRLKIQQSEADDTNTSRIHFEISDTGIGMSPEYLSRIWSPFEQADASISRRFGGTGLGLSITKSLVTLLGGEISVKSAAGVGTTFLVDLTFERTEQQSSSGVYDFSAVNALVVDDDVGTCDYIRLLFNHCGAKCAVVTSGVDAIRAVCVAKENNEPFTLCLVDWHMPGMDGIETIQGIRESVGNDMPIIVLTAYDYTEVMGRALQAGVNKFVSKPLFQSSLFDLLANISGVQSGALLENEKKTDFNGAQILLVEDNRMNMEIAKRILQSANLQVESAWNGKEAVAKFAAAAPGTYAAILMDVHMPEMDGHEATRIIRASDHPEAKTIPIIAMTADAFAENVAEAHEAGMNDHIAKPIDVQTLFLTLRQYIKHL